MELGYANPDAMLVSMPSAILTEWQAFFMWREEQRETAERRAKDAASTQERARAEIGRR